MPRFYVSIREFLKKYSDIEIELLLSYVLGKSKEFLYLHPEYKLTRTQAYRLIPMIKRRLKAEPIAYILGYKDFMGLRLKVNKSVLIPRPETEELVERVAQGIALHNPGTQASGLDYIRQVKILDLGTGSGCIAVSLAKQLSQLQNPNSQLQIVASDISKQALKFARQNAKTHKVKIQFVQSNLFARVKGKFDIIVANLPYVPRKIYELNFENLKFEPASALTDGTSSFQMFRRFFEQVGGYINIGGKIFLEIDPSSRKALVNYQKKYLPSADIKFYRDFRKFFRYAEITIV